MRDKLGRFVKDLKPWNVGLTKETDVRVLRISESQKGDKNSHFGKGPWNKGKTKETDERVKRNTEGGSRKTQFKKGHHPYNKNKRGLCSVETIEKMSKAKKGKISWNKNISPSAETKEKIRVANQGKKYGETTRKKHSEGATKMWQNPKIREKIIQALKGKIRTEEAIRKSLCRRIPSSLEKELQRIIVKHNLPYRFTGDGSFIVGNCNPDFINTNNEKVAIEVYASYFKQIGDRTVASWKKARTKVFKKFGWQVIFFDESELKDEKNLIEKLKTFNKA